MNDTNQVSLESARQRAMEIRALTDAFTRTMDRIESGLAPAVGEDTP